MPVPESKARCSVGQVILLATGLGVIFGFQSLGLAKWGFNIPTPWCRSACLFLIHVLLGFSVGATAGIMPWWKRGPLIGSVFGILSAFGAHALGLRWVPYGVASITEGLAAGLLIALLLDAVLPRTPAPADPLPLPSEPPAAAVQAKSNPCPGRTIRLRLAEETACLEDLDAQRNRRGDSGFGKTIEDRIVWGELLELELQEIDERVSHIGGPAGRRPRTSAESNTHLRKGDGPHERNDS